MQTKENGPSDGFCDVALAFCLGRSNRRRNLILVACYFFGHQSCGLVAL